MWYRLHVSEINIKIYDIIINTSQSIKSRISYNDENYFPWNAWLLRQGEYIYSFLFSVSLKNSNILNDLEQLLDHTQVSKHSVGFKWRNRGCIIRFYKTIILSIRLLSLVRLLHLNISKLKICMIKDKIITSTSRGRWILVFTIAAFWQMVNYFARNFSGNFHIWK